MRYFYLIIGILWLSLAIAELVNKDDRNVIFLCLLLGSVHMIGATIIGKIEELKNDE